VADPADRVAKAVSAASAVAPRAEPLAVEPGKAAPLRADLLKVVPVRADLDRVSFPRLLAASKVDLPRVAKGAPDKADRVDLAVVRAWAKVPAWARA